jgi:multicomponent Na+:H+ antiporter subunit A
MLAYTTMASLGLLVMLTGFGTEKAIEGAVLYLVAHSLFKGALFMVAGTVDHEAGTRDITKLGGLAKAMPITFTAAVSPRFRWADCRRSSVSSPRRRSITASRMAIPGRSVFTLVAIIGNGADVRDRLRGRAEAVPRTEGRNPETRP